MKVRDLVAKLNEFDPENDVVCYCEVESILPMNHLFRIFEIDSIDLKEAEKARPDDGVPTLKFGKTDQSSPHVLIDITPDF